MQLHATSRPSHQRRRRRGRRYRCRQRLDRWRTRWSRGQQHPHQGRQHGAAQRAPGGAEGRRRSNPAQHRRRRGWGHRRTMHACVGWWGGGTGQPAAAGPPAATTATLPGWPASFADSLAGPLLLAPAWPLQLLLPAGICVRRTRQAMQSLLQMQLPAGEVLLSLQAAAAAVCPLLRHLLIASQCISAGATPAGAAAIAARSPMVDVRGSRQRQACCRRPQPHTRTVARAASGRTLAAHFWCQRQTAAGAKANAAAANATAAIAGGQLPPFRHACSSSNSE